MNEWKDISTYTKNDEERIPSIWELRVGKVRLLVHRHLHYEEDQWLMSVHGDVSVTNSPLLKKDVDEAKREAIQAMFTSLDRMAREFRAYLRK